MILKSKLIVGVMLLFTCILYSCESKKHEPVTLTFSTAASHVLVITFTDQFSSLPIDPLSTTTDDYRIDGNAPTEVHHAVRVVDQKPKTSDGRYPMESSYSIYLVLDTPLQHEKAYSLETPFGDTVWIFDELATICESIKVNQVGYHPKSTTRYGNLGIFMGSGGSMVLDPSPNYRVICQESGRILYRGIALYKGDDTIVDSFSISSGEHVYRLDLSEVPPGGPYRIHVEGFGISHPFSISMEAIQESSYVYTRGLYHQRCGIALEEPYTQYTRELCHDKVALTRKPWSSSSMIDVDPMVPTIDIAGGYHDAGDFDRRPYHTIVPLLMLSYYEAFPTHFRDGAYDIPESGNGLPDFLDEALWGLKIWENLQITDPRDRQVGGIMAGTETSRHPEYGKVSASTDNLIYGTWAVSFEVTSYGVGLMAHAARLLYPFDAYREQARQLLDRALLGWNFLETHYKETLFPASEEIRAELLYATLQLSLALPLFGYKDTADVIMDQFEHLAYTLLVEGGTWPHQYRPGNSMAKITTAHFISYLLQPELLHTPLGESLHNVLITQVKHGGYMGFDMEHAYYPHGVTKSYGWGAATAQGRYADPYIFAYRLEEDEEEQQRLFDIISQYSDYALGLNPLGISFVTGLGSHQVNSPLQLDSWFTKERGLGNVPGIVLYGPTMERSGATYQKIVSDRLYPKWEDLPAQRRWSDGWSLVNSNEFTVWETMVWNICLFGFLIGIS